MLITITDQNRLQTIDIDKDDTIRVVDGSVAVDLFEIIDDLLAIDWMGMASNLFMGIGNLWIEQEFEPEYPFVNYETFHQWLKDHDCLYKESLNPVTYNMLKTQFPKFSEQAWDRFYNAFIFLNSEGYYSEISPNERRDLFYKMFPKLGFFSPFSKTEKNPIKMLSQYVFSSNLEMLVYDIFRDIYKGDYDCPTEPEVRDFCANLSEWFRIKKRHSEDIEYQYSVDQFIKDFFTTSNFGEITAESYDKLEMLHSFLCSKDFNNLLMVEFRMSEYENMHYGQERIPISYFVDSDLLDRFKCKNYLYSCYEQYEITGIDIFNLNNEVNLVLLLGLYASCFTNLSFGKCNTCGHYFVRNKNNRTQIQCDRCKAYVSQFTNVTEIQEQKKIITRNSQTARSRMNKDFEKRSGNESSFYELLGGDKRIFDLYDEMIEEYRRKIDEVIMLLSCEHILFRYDIMDEYGLVELADQIKEEKKMVPIQSTQYGMLDFDFLEFYNDYLSKKSFFKMFKLANDSLMNKSKFHQASLQLQITFAKMRSVFLSYNLDVSQIEDIQNRFCDLLNESKVIDN